MNVTGTVNPDVSRTVPVVSLATGRVVEIRARLGDTVKKGQLLLRVQSADMSGAFSDYRKAVADEHWRGRSSSARSCCTTRAPSPQNDLEVAQDTEDKAKVDVENTTEHLRVLGASTITRRDRGRRGPGVGRDHRQQVTNAAGVQGLDDSPNPFTISDLSHVWIVCDVYENDLPTVISAIGRHPPERVSRSSFHRADQQHRADPGPDFRTAKVRIEVANPGLMRLGMFVTATFHGQRRRPTPSVPATAILHLHDREWVYVPAGRTTSSGASR